MNTDPAYTDPAGGAPKKLTRSQDRMIAGVCGGLADYFGLDTSLVRVLYVLAAFLLSGVPVLAYPVLWYVMPERGA